jgi:putative transposase
VSEKVRKTIKVKVCDATNQTKLNILERELQRWQKIMNDIFEEGKTDYHDVKTKEIHSCYASLATFKVDTPNEPMTVKNTMMKVERRNTSLAPYWVSIPTKERRGGVWLPLEMPYKYYGFEEEWDLRDSHVTKQDDGYYIHLNIETEVDLKSDYSGILGIDLGVRHVAVTWSTVKEKPRFYGKELRRIRGKYHYLRRKLQSEKKIEAVDNIKDREFKKTDNKLHEISREIVDRAKEQDLAIFIGDLSDYRGTDFGKSGNRRLHSAPIYELKRQIKYKAREQGLLCEVIDEAFTTVTCSECGHQRDSRPGKEFSCPECGYQVNSDVNGSKNIASRGFGYMSESGAFADSPNPASNYSIDGFSDDGENRNENVSVVSHHTPTDEGETSG